MSTTSRDTTARALESHEQAVKDGTAQRQYDMWVHWIRCLLAGELRRRDLPFREIGSGHPSTWARPARERAA